MVNVTCDTVLCAQTRNAKRKLADFQKQVMENKTTTRFVSLGKEEGPRNEEQGAHSRLPAATA